MEITELLDRVKEGDSQASDALFAQVYAELRRIAAIQRRQRLGLDTLSTTALVHEAYLKLIGNRSPDCQDRQHFFAVAATAMRHILLDAAERRMAAKRGGGLADLDLDEQRLMSPETAEEVLVLHEALTRLELIRPRHARVVELKFFAGMEVNEIAQVLGTSAGTVKRDWMLARNWLGEQLDHPV